MLIIRIEGLSNYFWIENEEQEDFITKYYKGEAVSLIRTFELNRY